jgi:hypothetical protein
MDVDLCYRRTALNLERLAAALRELSPTLRGAPANRPFRIDAQALALGSSFIFDTHLGELDLLGWVEPIGTYDDLILSATTERLGDVEVRVISLDDLIRIRRHINRPKDRESLFQLEAIKRIREERGR